VCVCAQDDLLENDVTRHLEGNLGPEYTYCMRFGYGEQSIHEDLYGVILHVVESVCEPAEVDKVRTRVCVCVCVCVCVVGLGRGFCSTAALIRSRDALT